MENKIQTQVLHLEGKKRLNISGVKSVDGFTDDKIRITAETGRIIITGARLKINCFAEATGAFSCEGEVFSVTLASQKQGFIKGLFK